MHKNKISVINVVEIAVGEPTGFHNFPYTETGLKDACKLFNYFCKQNKASSKERGLSVLDAALNVCCLVPVLKQVRKCSYVSAYSKTFGEYAVHLHVTKAD
jgi:hypothetical protein